MKIIIGADIVPTKNNMELFKSGDAQTLLGEGLLKVLNEVDFRVFNLEVPLTDQKTPIPKLGPNLIASTKCITGYKSMNINLLTLANNHIMDQGIQGLESTLETLGKSGIAYVGVGENKKEASKPFIFENEEKRVGVYACVEHEFSTANNKRPGANPFDQLVSFDHVAKLKEQCDYIIVLYHGGKEHYRYPSPDLQRNCRKFIEKGANLVVCQHSHCIGCEEKYLNGTIVYGQGNFLFDDCEKEEWQTSLLIEYNDGIISYIPLKKHKDKVRIANSAERAMILDGFRKRSEEIKDSEIIEDKYKEFSLQKLYEYLWVLSGANNSKTLRIINRLSGYKFYRYYLDRKYTASSILSMLNYFECEAHREVIIEGLKTKMCEEE